MKLLVFWLLVLALGLAGFLGLTVELSPAGLLTAIATDFDVSLASVGTLTTFFALGNALLVLPLTALAMRFSRRTALVAMMTVFVISNVIGPRFAGRAMSIVLAATALGMGLGAPIASLVGSAAGWRVTFIAAAGIALLVAVL